MSIENTKNKDLQATFAAHIINCKTCVACSLHETRLNVVKPRTRMSGEVNIDPSILVIGDAPGKEEDEKGFPFIGKSGQILESAFKKLNIADQVAYTNTVRCRPPGNRDPSKEEKEACFSNLITDIAIFKPDIIVTAGRHASISMLPDYSAATMESLTAVDRNPLYFHMGEDYKIQVIPIWHPAYYLKNQHNEDFKNTYWGQFIRIKQAYLDVSS